MIKLNAVMQDVKLLLADRNYQMKQDIRTHTLEEVAKKYGVTRQRVSQILGPTDQYRESYLGNNGTLSYIVGNCRYCDKEIMSRSSNKKPTFCSIKCRNTLGIKLNRDQMLYVQENPDKLTQEELAKKFKVSQQCVSRYQQMARKRVRVSW